MRKMTTILAKENLSIAEKIIQDNTSSYPKYEKAFSKLRLTLNALHLMKHTDKDNSEMYE